MAISSFRIDYERYLWTDIKAFCPICKNNFTGWYCPSCGLPKKNSKYALSEYGSLHNCGQYHFRPEFSSFENIQLCDKCYTTNPSNAKYCRNCGKKFTSSKGISKDAHGWVDLGLSVLWATETIEGLYMWNYAEKLYHTTDMDFYRKLEPKELNDVATQKWGERWRTPTKEEFEELVIKCKWEKCLHPISNKHALKITGPNGNSIIIPVTGYAGCKEKPIRIFPDISISMGDPEAEHSICALWTSSEDKTKPHRRAYAFHFRGYEGFTKTLTAKEKKEQEFKNNRDHRRFESMFEPIEIDYDWWKPGISEKRQQIMDKKEKRWQIERQKEEEERQILRNMGDDSQERADNIKKDEERRRSLWLDTPIEMHYNEERIHRNTIRPIEKDQGYAILPVADKKWQGCL